MDVKVFTYIIEGKRQSFIWGLIIVLLEIKKRKIVSHITFKLFFKDTKKFTIPFLMKRFLWDKIETYGTHANLVHGQVFQAPVYTTLV